MAKQAAELPIQNIVYILRNRVITVQNIINCNNNYTDVSVEDNKTTHNYALRSSMKKSKNHGYYLRSNK